MSGRGSPKGRYSKVSRRVWADRKFRALSAPPPCGQFLWFRLLCAPELGTVPGLFQGYEAGLAQALGWPLEGFREAFAEASDKGMAKADWKAGLVWLPNAIQYNEPDSPNVIRSWKNTWSELPECDLKDEAFSTLQAYAKGRGKAWAKAFAEACGHPSPHPSANQEQEQEQEQEGVAGDVDPIALDLLSALRSSPAAKSLDLATLATAERLLGVANPARLADGGKLLVLAVQQACSEADLVDGTAERLGARELGRKLRTYVESRPRVDRSAPADAESLPNAKDWQATSRLRPQRAS